VTVSSKYVRQQSEFITREFSLSGRRSSTKLSFNCEHRKQTTDAGDSDTYRHRLAWRMRARDSTSCRLILTTVGRRSRREHISGLSRRQQAAAATTTNHNETLCVVVDGENCFRCRHTEGATTAHLTYGSDVTRPVLSLCKRCIVSVAVVAECGAAALCNPHSAALSSIYNKLPSLDSDPSRIFHSHKVFFYRSSFADFEFYPRTTKPDSLLF